MHGHWRESPSILLVCLYIYVSTFSLLCKNLNTALKFRFWLLSFWVSVSISPRDPSLSSLYHTPEQAFWPLDPATGLAILPAPHIAFFEVCLRWFAKGVFGGQRELVATLQAVPGERGI